MHPAELLIKELTAFEYPRQANMAEEVDMVMKGGITSGVVYPLAVCELAKTRRFRNLGGSSAGGIAAGLAAVAELARDSNGFRRLAGLPVALGNDLLHIFQPSKETYPLFNILLAWMHKGKWRYARVMIAVVKAARGWFVLAYGLALLLAVAGILAAGGLPSRRLEWVRLALGLVIASLPALVLALIAAAISAGLASKARLSSNGYGLCRGSAGPAWPAAQPAQPTVEPFTDWLHATLNDVAGRGRTDVVTFGDLWGQDTDNPNIRLEMMTTNVTFCRPTRLPFESNLYSFCRAEMEQWFPPPIVEHLVAHARTPGGEDYGTCVDHHQPLLGLPEAADLPVLVAIRMTLSFPVLISAVPLFAVDYGREEPEPVRCWFSDGGISSNFPIHFFDALWPGRPTFAISLAKYPKGPAPQDVYYRGTGTISVPRVRDTSSLTGFFGAIADTVQNWSDEGQTEVGVGAEDTSDAVPPPDFAGREPRPVADLRVVPRF